MLIDRYGELLDHWDHRKLPPDRSICHLVYSVVSINTRSHLANCVAWVRKGDEEHDGCVTVICNGKDEGSKKCEVGKEHAGETWTDVMGWYQGEVKIGDGELHVDLAWCSS